MNTFTAEPLSVSGGYDIPTDVAAVVEATRHLCDFRAGFAEVLETLAELAAKRMPDEGQRILTPALRILGADKAEDIAHDLYVAACQVIGGWDPNVDPDDAHHRLQRLCAVAAHAVSDEFHADSRVLPGHCRRHPMTGPEHYKEAERLVTFAVRHLLDDDPTQPVVLAQAQVHATLALAAATALAHDRMMPDRDGEGWRSAACAPNPGTVSDVD